MLIPTEEHFSMDRRIDVMSIRQDDLPSHQHAFLEMAYVTGGRGLHTLDGAQMEVEKGDYCIVNYGTEHAYQTIGGQPFELINILFQPDLIDKSLAGCHSFQDLINHYLLQVRPAALERPPADVMYHDSDGTIYALVNKIREEFDGQAPGYIALIRCHIIEIILKTMRTVCKNEAGFWGGPMEQVKAYLDEHYMEPVTLTAAARRFGFSPAYLSRRFKWDTGTGFMEYLHQRRMLQSGRMLANTDKKIGEIAELAGYADQKFFTSLFKKHWGMTPGEFKKTYK
ncbi:MAG: AraC family transcriptional regulator [Clostridiales bacterium]|nr:AraC family transcriptional regulator [Clostridiales bacterium]